VSKCERTYFPLREPAGFVAPTTRRRTALVSPTRLQYATAGYVRKRWPTVITLCRHTVRYSFRFCLFVCFQSHFPRTLLRIILTVVVVVVDTFCCWIFTDPCTPRYGQSCLNNNQLCCLCFTADSYSNDKMKRDNWMRTDRLWCLFLGEYPTRKTLFITMSLGNCVQSHNQIRYHCGFLTQNRIIMFIIHTTIVFLYFSFTRKDRSFT